MTVLDDQSVLVGGKIPERETTSVVLLPPAGRITAVRLELLTHDSLPGKGPGHAGNGNFLLHEVDLELVAAENTRRENGDPVKDADSAGDSETTGAIETTVAPTRLKVARVEADHSQPNFPVAHTIDGNSKTAWAINLGKGQPGTLHVDRTAVFVLRKPHPIQPGTGLRITLHQNQDHYLLGRFRLSVTGADASTIRVDLPDAFWAALKVPADKRTKEQRSLVTGTFQKLDPERETLLARKAALQRAEKKLAAEATTSTLVMQERSKPRETFVHIRGEFLRRGKTVAPNVPDSLPPLPSPPPQSHATKGGGAAPDRLDLARWLVSDKQPLTPRVVVNRAWQRFFGVGLVETENDFGAQGALPSHPELLDWLADELRQNKWSMKRLHRMIVMSATYRQSSRSRPELDQKDPRNRLLGRQNRVRLEAEVIRDTILESSGLLSSRMKGPSVYPPQPAGVMKMTRNPNRRWVVSSGENRYRRGMYTYFWRSTPHPFLKLFNAPESNTTCTRRDRSNTPLQALTLLNDDAFVEAALALAGRVLREVPADDDARLRYAFELCLARRPSAAESAALRDLLLAERREAEFAMQTDHLPAAKGLAAEFPPRELAAWTAVARTMLNLDEFITRE